MHERILHAALYFIFLVWMILQMQIFLLINLGLKALRFALLVATPNQISDDLQMIDGIHS